MKLIREHGDFDWADEVQLNPFGLDLAVIFFNKKLTKEDAEYIMDLVDDYGIKYESRYGAIESLIHYSPGGYIKSVTDNKGVKVMRYGDNIELFEELKWHGVLSSLNGKPYVEFMVTDILPKRNMSEGDLDWIKNQDVNPWLEYDAINFDIVPSEEDVARYIELALSTRKIENSEAWTKESRQDDIEIIIDFVKEGGCYLAIGENSGTLSYGGERYYPKDIKKINYSTLIGKPLNESDDFDWIRDTQPWVSFEEAQIGQRYNIEKDEILLDALKACDEYEYIYYDSVTAEVERMEYNEYSSTYCDSENHDRVISLRLTFYNEDGINIGYFWVTEDMVTLYPIYDNINESSDDLDWIRNTHTLMPLTDYIETYGIEKIDIPNKLVGLRVMLSPKSEFYDEGYETNPIDVEGTIIEEKAYYDKLPITVNWDNGLNNSYAPIDLDIVFGNINESNENPFQWIEDVPAGIQLEPNTFYYFEPPLTMDEIPLFSDTIQNSNHIKKWLLSKVMNNLTKTGAIGVKYFVTSDNLESNVGGWCTETDIDYAKRMYYRQKPVDARKEFGL